MHYRITYLFILIPLFIFSLFAAINLSLIQQSASAAEQNQISSQSALTADALIPSATSINKINAINNDSDPCLDEAQSENLVANPSFEGDYSAYDPIGGHPDCIWGPCNSAQMAAGWTPYWRSHNPDDPGYIIRMPEYKPDIAADHWIGPIRTRSGERAQQYFSFSSTHEAGFYQQVPAVPDGTYCFSIWGHGWTAQDAISIDSNGNIVGDALSGPDYGNLRQKIGIDPTGGTDWTSSNIIWSDQDDHPNGRFQYDEFGIFVITATAQADTITIFAYSQPDWAVAHNNVYWDDANVTLTNLPQMSLPSTGGLFALTTVSETMALSLDYPITLSGYPSMTWQAEILPGNTVTPTLSATNGVDQDTLTIETSTAGLPDGIYTATVRIMASPEVATSPVDIPVKLVIAPQIYRQFAPLTVRP